MRTGWAALIAALGMPGVAVAQWPGALTADQLDGTIHGIYESGALGAQVLLLGGGALEDCDQDGQIDDPVLDFDGDGLAEVAISVPGDDAGGTDSGKVLLYLGREVWRDDLTAPDADVFMRGEAAFDIAGTALASGDLNGDCLTDLIVASPPHDGSRGRVYVAFGRASPPASFPLVSADLKIAGISAGDELGGAVSAGWDVTGDGLSDLVVGAPGASGPSSTYEGAGRVYVVPGQRGFAPGTFTIDAVASAGWYGAARNEEMGGSVLLLPDLEGGGAADLLLGAPKGTANGKANAGKIYLITGESRDSWPVSGVIGGSAQATWRGTAVNQLAGDVLSLAGDVDGDGQADVLVGGPGDATGGAGAGMVWLVIGASPGTGTVFLSDIAAAAFAGPAAGADLSHAAGAGDMDGDGLDDLVVSAPGYDPAGAGGGRAWVLPGRGSWAGASLASASLTIDGVPGLGLGASVDAGRDVDGDGAPDILLGAPSATASDLQGAGAAYLARTGLFTDADGDGISPFDGDCDDADEDVEPGAEEIACNQVDEDCSGADLGDVDEDGWLGCAYVDEDQRDCDDQDPDVHPTAAERCDGGDDDCDVAIDEDAQSTFFRDADEDGFGAAADTVTACAAPDGYVADGTDCDDDDPAIHPEVEEVCDGADQDCDDVSDEGTLTVYYDDVDTDGWGGAPQEQCDALPGQVTEGGDCDDGDPLIRPDAVEACGDEVDEDCSGALDDPDVDGDGWVDAACEPYVGENAGDCDDADPDRNPGLEEACGDGIDNDCSGAEDDRALDEDGDTYVAALCGGNDCDDGAPLVNPGRPEVCGDAVDNDCSGAADDLDVDEDGAISSACGGDDCDDNNPGRAPSLTEVACDGIDQDCSGGDLTDADGDGATGCGARPPDCNDQDTAIGPEIDEIPYDGIDQDCDGEDPTDLDGDGYDAVEAGGDDCDDDDPLVHPGAQEIPYDGIDQDCVFDDPFDVDGDGYGGGSGPDCDDEEPDTYPGAPEVAYDGVDQDCDGRDLTDVDQDGHDAQEADGDDCDDADPDTYPGAYEAPADGVDNDCNRQVDDYATDVDHDGDGVTEADEPGDCAPLDPAIFPGAEEIAGDGVDEDCDGHIDEPSGAFGEVSPAGCGCGTPEDTTPASQAQGGLLFLSAAAGIGALRRRRG